MVKVNEKVPMNEADVSRIMEAFGSMAGSARRRACDEPEQTAASSTGRRRTDPLMETEEIHFGQEPEQHARNPDPVTQRLEAQMLRDAIINFSDRNQIDTTDLLDQIYAEITGLAAQTRRPYQGPPWPPTTAGPMAYVPQQTPPPPVPETDDPINVPVPTEHVPDEALITWGKHTGKRFMDLHQDLKYVRWVLSNGSRFNPEDAMAVTDYLDQHYYLTTGKRRILMRRTEP